MKILMVTATYPPTTNGVAVTVKNLKKSLSELGNEVMILAPENVDSKKEDGVIRYPSFQNPVIKDYPIPLFPGTRSIYKSIRSFKPDVVHVHHPMYIGYFAKNIADKYKAPLVFTFHTRYDLYAEKYASYLPKKLRKYLLENTIYNFCEKTDLIISPSDFINKALIKRYPYLNVKTIPTPVFRVTKSKILLKKLRQSLSLPFNKKILFCVARLGREKNLEVLIRSMSNLPDEYCLTIAGTGPDEDKLKTMAVNLGLIDRIIFLGKIPHEKINGYYQASDIFYYSSQTETQGLVFLEAISCGLPVVAVRSMASKEWIKDSFGVLCGNDADELSNSVIRIFKNDIRKMKNEALKYSSNFLSPILTKKLVAAYDETIERKKLAYKLLGTGWQSWSLGVKKIIKFPTWEHKPNKDYYLPEVSTNLKLKSPAIGWCSWYNFGTQINEKIIIDQTKWFSKNKYIPINYILVDEGWTERGDWDRVNSEKFPNGLSSLSEKIVKFGFRPGIWMSPFLVSPKSFVFERNKKLVVRSGGVFINGTKAFPPYDWFNPNYILDIRKVKARKLIYRNLDLLLGKYKFQLVKLDFLYSIFFIPGISEKEAGYYLRKIFQYIKDKYPDVYTIASGAPFAPLVGITNSIRIAPDIIIPQLLENNMLGKFIHGRKLLAVKNALNLRS
jgi:1,2-diacylglycerol 3-alpha-glucosyltransferase